MHHAQGLTPGARAFGDQIAAAGHTVHAPDLSDGRTFETLDAGLAYAQEVGFGTIVERGGAAASGLPEELVHVGFPLGVVPAQTLARARAGARVLDLLARV